MYTTGKISGKVPEIKHVLDQWVIARLEETIEQVTAALDNYSTVKAGRSLTEFINDLSTWYVRRSRDRIKAGGPESDEALAVLGYVLTELSKLMAPFMPFFADFLYKDLTGEESVHLSNWPDAKQLRVEKHVIADMAAMRHLVELGLSLRKDSSIKVRQPLAKLQYVLKGGEVKQLSFEIEAILAEELNLKKVEQVDDVVPHASFLVRTDNSATVALDTHLTPELELEGVARELERHIQDLRKKSGLNVGEVVDVYYNTQNEQLIHALTTLVDRKKTFVGEIAHNLEIEADFETQAEVDGKAIWLGLLKAK